MMGRPFTLVTDHNALLQVMRVEELGRNWLSEILLFDLEVIHHPGLEKITVDALSRRLRRITPRPAVSTTTNSTPTPTDPSNGSSRSQLSPADKVELLRVAHHFTMHGILLTIWKFS